MVVGAGSRHYTGLIYESVDDKRNILPCPSWLVSYVLRTADAPKPHSSSRESGRDRRLVHENFDFENMCAHYEPIFRIVGDANDYYFPDPCPWTDHRHESAPKTGFYWDGSSLGWSDFVTSCDGCEVGIGATIKHLNARMVELGHEPYGELIWEEEPLEDLLDYFGVETVVLEPKYRYKFTYSLNGVCIYSNNGLEWFYENGEKV
jgi:hypothetical protein